MLTTMVTFLTAIQTLEMVCEYGLRSENGALSRIGKLISGSGRRTHPLMLLRIAYENRV